MQTERIPPAAAPYPQPIADAFARVMPPGVEPLLLFRTMARSPRVLQRMFAGSLLDKGAVDLRARELMILRTTARCGSEYEWGVHVSFFAEKAGLQRQHIGATLAKDLDAATWSADDLLVLRLADALHEAATVPTELWEALKDAMSAEQILELIALAGYYHTISFMTNALDLPSESYAARFAHFSTVGSTAGDA
jgi:alkylhydroperoxidase family enzyme